jgi:hypothetical protein
VRNLVVDTMGLVIAVTVTAASVQDRDAADAVVAQACAEAPGLEKLYTDGAYGGKCGSRHRAAAPYPYRSRTACAERHDQPLHGAAQATRPPAESTLG